MLFILFFVQEGVKKGNYIFKCTFLMIIMYRLRDEKGMMFVLIGDFDMVGVVKDVYLGGLYLN